MIGLMKVPGMRGAMVEAIVRKFWVPFLVTLVFATTGCGSSKLTNHPDGSDANLQDVGSDRVPPESPNDASLEAPSAEVSLDQKADAIDWNVAVECIDMTCGAGEACISWVGGLMGGGPANILRRCVAALDACGSGLDCSCIDQHFGTGCGNECTQVTARQFSCGEGNGGNNDPDQFKVCPLAHNVGCFTGEICRSPQTDPMCVRGAWQCPFLSQATEFCPPDSGTGDASDSGG